MRRKRRAGFAPPKTSGLAVSDWENNTAPKLNGKPIALMTLRDLDVARHRAGRLPLRARHGHMALRAYRADGGELWQKPVPGVAWA